MIPKGRTNYQISVSTFFTILGSFFSLFNFAYLAQTLTVENFILITSWAAAFAVLWEVFDFGRTTYLLRNYRVVGFNQIRYERDLKLTKLYLFIIFIIIVLLINSVSRTDALFYLVFLGGYAFLQSVNLTSGVYFRSTNNLIILSLIFLIEKTILLILLFYFHSNLLQMSFVFFVSSGISFSLIQWNRALSGNLEPAHTTAEKIDISHRRLGLGNTIRIVSQLDLILLNWFFGPSSNLVTYTLMSKYSTASQTIFSQFLSSFQNLSFTQAKSNVWQEHKFLIKLGIVSACTMSIFLAFSKSMQEILFPHEKQALIILCFISTWIVLDIFSSMQTALLISNHKDGAYVISQIGYVFFFILTVFTLPGSVDQYRFVTARLVALTTNLVLIQLLNLQKK